jgi:hypothetical protein
MSFKKKIEMEQMGKVEYIAIHHTKREIDFPALIKLRHKLIKGWEDIGYHWIIGNGRLFTEEGEIYAGRQEIYAGAHVQGYNNRTIGIAVMGDFNSRFPSSKQMSSLLRLVKEKIEEYNVPVNHVLGHREFPNTHTSCPGKNLSVEDIRKILSR